MNQRAARIAPLLLFGLAWGTTGAACSPLHDFSSLSKNYGAGGSSNGGSPSGGGSQGGQAGASGSICGDGIVEGNEVCEPAGEQSKDCELNCRKPACGDGVVNELAGEICDTSGSTPSCFRCDKSDPPCPSNCQCVDRAGHRYALCDTAKVIEEATSICQDAGFELASLEDRSEEAFVIGEAMDRFWPEVWLGGSDAAAEGAWRWSSSDQLFYSGVAPSGTTPAGAYSNFAAGEPNDVNESQNYLIYGAQNGGWLDAAGGEVRSFVCERNPLIPTSCGDGALDSGEACDDQGESDSCDSDCTSVSCGDAIVNKSAGEECDDGNADELDGCASCKASGLLVYYPLSEQRGAIAYDRGPSSVNATIYGGANVLDQLEGAIFYPPSYAKFGSNKLQFSDFTLSFGLKSSSWSGGLFYLLRDEGGLSSFHARATGTEFEVYSLDEMGTRHPPALRLQGSSGENGNGSSFVHFAYTCASGHWIAYRNGAEIDSEDDPDGKCRAPSGATNFILGADTGGSTKFLTGTLKEFRLYDRALGASEIAILNNIVGMP